MFDAHDMETHESLHLLFEYVSFCISEFTFLSASWWLGKLACRQIDHEPLNLFCASHLSASESQLASLDLPKK